METSKLKEFKEVVVHPNHRNQKIQIGRKIPQHLKDKVIQFLSSQVHNSSWCMQDMRGIDPSIVEPSLNINPVHKVVKQNLSDFGEDKLQGMKDEVDKLLISRFIRKLKYPSWLANVVMVKKLNRKWRMCVDYTDLNKACPMIVMCFLALTP